MKWTKKDILVSVFIIVCVTIWGFDYCVKTLVAAAAIKYLWGDYNE